MMNVEQIVNYVEARLETLSEINDNALYNLMRNDIDKETFNMYERIYDDNFERMIELRRLLRTIINCDTDTEHDIE